MRRLFLIGIFVLFGAQSQGQTLYVPSERFAGIQSAINSASDGDVIIVSPGTYYENINFLGRAITVRSVEPNDPDIVAGTVIDGSKPADPNMGSVVTFCQGEDNRAVLSGFTIRGGTGTWILVSWKFEGRRWNRCGGGVVCYNMSEPTISKNVIAGNLAGQGGGIYIYGRTVNPDDPQEPDYHVRAVITDNILMDNFAVVEHGFLPPDVNYPSNDHGDGGAIVAFQGCDAVITGNLIQENRADSYGGGLHLRQWSNGLIEDNRIIGNGAALGGGIHITYCSSPTIRGNLIEGNRAGGLGGGGIYVYYRSWPLIECNRITGNYSPNGSGIAIKYSSGPEVRSNLIDNNLAGSAIACTSSAPIWIHHNTIINNSVSEAGYPGGIECIGPEFPTIENNIIASTHGGYGIYIFEGGGPIIRYNNLWDNDLGTYGPYVQDINRIEGNISVEPRFMDGLGHLHYTSACIDAGSADFVPAADEVDFDGDRRIINRYSDIGADEVMPVWNLSKRRQYEAIQAAIDDATGSDTMVVLPGRYYENIQINGKSIKLQSVNPASWDCIESTIIASSRPAEAVVTFAGVEDANCILAGLTIADANNSGPGGGIAGNGTGATLSFCRVTGNTAGQGGGIDDFDGLIQNCKITNNISDTSGGGLSRCDGQIYNCFISDNCAGVSGGGLYDCDADIINDTIAGNAAGLSAGALQSCRGTITNCVVWSNAAPREPGLSGCSQPAFSCLQDAVAGAGNIYLDPRFVEPGNRDYHLTVYSDCIDAGDNSAVAQQSVFDIDKEPRIFTSVANKSPVVDMGADEVVTNNSDFNGDGKVGYQDLSIMVNEWANEGLSLQTDLIADGLVNLKDYARFAKNWAWQARWQRSEKESALQFDSSSDGYLWIHTPRDSTLNNVFTFTYTAWIYPLDFSQTQARIIGKNERAVMISTGGTLVGYSHHIVPAQSVSEVGLLKANRWQFIVMTFNHTGDKKVHLYVNGKEATYQYQHAGRGNPVPDWRAEGQWDLMVGSQAWYPGTAIPDVIIDEVAIYDRVLRPGEIEFLYNGGLGRPTPLWLNPIGLWHLDEKQGAIVIDSSGNNNPGRLMGTAPPVWTDGRFIKY